MLTAGVLCWWVVLVEAAPVVGIEEPDGMAVGAKMRGRFTVLPQMLRIAGEDPAGGHYRVALSHEPAEDVRVLVEGIEGTDLTVQPSSLTFTPENWAEFWIHGNIRRARPWNIARARSVGRISER